MISIGFNLREEKVTPKRMMLAHTSLNLNVFKPPCHPRQPLTTYAAAKGAVIEEVIPAAKRPTPINHPAKSPNKGFKPCARSAALFTLVKPGTAEVITIAIETNPPNAMATINSFLAMGNCEGLFHFSPTKEACKNRL